MDPLGTFRIGRRIDTKQDVCGFLPGSAVTFRVEEADEQRHMLPIVGSQCRAERRFVLKIRLRHCTPRLLIYPIWRNL